MIDYALPQSRCDEIRRGHPDVAEQWIENYPALLKSCAEQWDLTLLETITVGWPSNTIYFAVTGEGCARVLKVCFPHAEMFTEMRTLALLRGKLAVELIAIDEGKGALLLERLQPGQMLREFINQPDRIAEAVFLLRDLPQPIDNDVELPSFLGWLKKAFSEFRQGKNYYQDEFLFFVAEAEKSFAVISENSKSDWILHGDLHHENILFDENRGWLAIDPKGVTGPRLMECGRFLHNFLDDELQQEQKITDTEVADLAALLGRRYQVVGALLGYSEIDLAMASFVDITMSTCWTLNRLKPQEMHLSAENGMQRVRAAYAVLNEHTAVGQ